MWCQEEIGSGGGWMWLLLGLEFKLRADGRADGELDTGGRKTDYQVALERVP